MNYNKLESMLNTTENMVVLRNNTKQDDGVDTVVGVDWFKFNNVVCSNIYVSGNSFIGFGANAQHLNVCNRDGALYTLSREEGTLFNHYRFIKVRWEGHSHYNSTDIYSKLIYEVFLFDTGDVFVNLIQVPTSSSYLGTSTILSNGTNIPLGVELGTPCYISIYHQDDIGKLWVVKKELLDIQEPFVTKYLVRSNEKYYTVKNDLLEEIQVSALDSEIFKINGFEKQSFSFLKDMENPGLLSWSDTDIELGEIVLKANAKPFDQTLVTKSYDCTDPSIKGVTGITTESSSVSFQLSFDKGITYEIYRNGWIISTDEWMTKEELQALTNAEFDLKNVMEYSLKMKMMEFGYLKSIIIKYKNGE